MGTENEIVTLDNEHGNIQTSVKYFLRFNFPKDVKVLDIGCGYGSLIYNLHKLGYKNISGIEISKKRLEKGKKKYPEFSEKLKHYPGKKIPCGKEACDVVLMFDVIEHIPDVGSFLKEEVYDVLKKDGIFIFQTPNKRINIPWEIINKSSFTKWKSYHCSLQTRRSMKTLLNEAGFRDIIIEKESIVTPHNKKKIRKKIGFLGAPILYLLNKMPLDLYPNFWGNCRK